MQAFSTPQFLAFFFSLFLLAALADWLVRKYGSPQLKALFASGDHEGGAYGTCGLDDMEARVRKLEATLTKPGEK